MKRHLAYLRYILRHKWFVFLACRLTGCSLWRGLVHDISKFRPSEWFPYARYFYERDGSGRKRVDADLGRPFERAWLLHQRRNPHHWQAWILREDSGATLPLEMPERYVREMVADWIGAGRAIAGRVDPWPWYLANRERIVLHPETRTLVEGILRWVNQHEVFGAP